LWELKHIAFPCVAHCCKNTDVEYSTIQFAGTRILPDKTGARDAKENAKER